MSDISQLSDEEFNKLYELNQSIQPAPKKRDITQLSDAEFATLTTTNPPGPMVGLFDAFNESIAELAGAPGSLLYEGAKFLGVENIVGETFNPMLEYLGLPEFKGEPILTSKGLKTLMADIGMTSGLEFDERTAEGKIGARAGQVLGYTAPFTLAMGVWARGVNLTKTLLAGYNPTMIKKIVDSAAKYPKRFWVAEGGATTGAVTGAVFSEASFPGNHTALIINEILGTLINPAGQVTKLTMKVGTSAKTLAASFSRGAKEEQAMVVLREMLEEMGEDIPALIKLMDQPDIIKLTPGLKTGSPTLLALEQKLAKTHPKYSEKIKAIEQTAFTDLRQIIDNFTASGDPALLRVAAKLRQRYFDDIITARLNMAKREAAEASARLAEPGFKSIPSVNIQAIHTQALKDLRMIEKEMWGKIPQQIEINPVNLREGIERAKSELLLEENLPLQGEIRRAIGRMLEREEGSLSIIIPGVADDVTKIPTTSGDLLKLRNRALDESRQFRSEGKYRHARLTDMIADSVLADLETLGLKSVKEAREFSASLHKNFMNTFAGDILEKTKKGKYKISPEMVLERAFGPGGTSGKIRMNELVDAGKYADNQFLAPIIGDAVRNEEERFLRMLATETMQDGIVDAGKLTVFKEKNAQLLQRFPLLAKQIETAGKATKALRNTEALTGQVNKSILRKAAFAKMLEVENPTIVITQILDGKNPIKDYQKLVNVARKGGPGTLAGLRTATIDSMITKSMTGNGLSFVKFHDNLMNAHRGQTSIFALMKKEKVMDKKFANEFEKLIKKAADIEQRSLTAREMGVVMDDPDQWFDFMVRYVGATAGGTLATVSSSGAGLVIAGAAVRTLRNQVEKIPASRVVDIIIEASESPEFMALILKRVKSAKQAEEIVTQLRTPLIAAGIIAVEEG